MKNTLEKLRKIFLSRRRQDDLSSSKFSRSLSFRKASMRRSLRRLTRRKAVVTNQGIVYVEGDACASKLPEPAIPQSGDLATDTPSSPDQCTDGAAAASTTASTGAAASDGTAGADVHLRRNRPQNRGLVVSSPPTNDAAPARSECRVQSGLIGGVADIFNQAHLMSGCVAYPGEMHKSPSVDRRLAWEKADNGANGSEPNTAETPAPETVVQEDTRKSSGRPLRGSADRLTCIETSIGSERVVSDGSGGVASKRVLYYADFELIDDSESVDSLASLSHQSSSDQPQAVSEVSLFDTTSNDDSGKARQRRDTDGDSGKASSSASGSLDRVQPKSLDTIPPEELHLLEEMLSNLATPSEGPKQESLSSAPQRLSDSPATDLQTALIRELEAKLAISSFSEEIAETSQSDGLGQNCASSGQGSGERNLLRGVAGPRRKPPTVVATRDHLRRSWRRLSNHRHKKTSGTRAPDPAALQPQQFYYRLCSQVPSLPTSTTSSPGAMAGPSNPFVFSRQNPVTQWLAESEAEARRASPAGHNSDVSLLWSELVLTSSGSVSATAPAPEEPVPAGARRRSKRVAKRGVRLRRSGRHAAAGKNTKSLVKTTSDVLSVVTSGSNPTLASDPGS